MTTNLTATLSLYPELFSTIVTNVQYFQHGLPLTPYQRSRLARNIDSPWEDEYVMSFITRVNHDFLFFSDRTEFVDFLTTLNHLLFVSLALCSGLRLLWSMFAALLPFWGRSDVCCNVCACFRRKSILYENDVPADLANSGVRSNALAGHRDRRYRPTRAPASRAGYMEQVGQEWDGSRRAYKEAREYPEAPTSPWPTVLAIGLSVDCVALAVLVVLFAPGISSTVFPGIAPETSLLVFMFVLLTLLLLGVCIIFWVLVYNKNGKLSDLGVQGTAAEDLWASLGQLTLQGTFESQAVKHSPAHARQFQSESSLGDTIGLDASVALLAYPFPLNPCDPNDGRASMVFDFDPARIRCGLMSERILTGLTGAIYGLSGMATVGWLLGYPYQLSPFSLNGPNLMFSAAFLVAFSLSMYGFLMFTFALLPSPLDHSWGHVTRQQTAPDGNTRLRDVRVPLGTPVSVARELTLSMLATLAFLEALQLSADHHRTLRSVGAFLLVFSLFVRRFLWALFLPWMDGDRRTEHLDEAQDFVLAWAGVPGGQEKIQVPPHVVGDAHGAGYGWAHWLMGHAPPARPDAPPVVYSKIAVAELAHRAIQSIRRSMVAPRLFLQLNAEDRHFRFAIEAVTSLVLFVGAVCLSIAPGEEVGGWMHLRDSGAWYFWIVWIGLATQVIFFVFICLRFGMILHRQACVTRLPVAYIEGGAVVLPPRNPPHVPSPSPCRASAPTQPMRRPLASPSYQSFAMDYESVETTTNFAMPASRPATRSLDYGYQPRQPPQGSQLRSFSDAPVPVQRSQYVRSLPGKGHRSMDNPSSFHRNYRTL
jgi:hypothetical protein